MKVLFITLSNIGDAVLTTPAISAILENFKDAEITLIASPRAADLFKGDPYIAKLIVYKKEFSFGKKMALIKTLRGTEFDLLVDFKNTLLPYLLYAKHKTSAFKDAPSSVRHMKDRHLWKLRHALPEIPNLNYNPKIWISEETFSEISRIFKSNNITDADKLVAVAPGARSHTKQWPKEGFLYVCKRLVKELGCKVVLAGDRQDSDLCSQIYSDTGPGIVNLCGSTSLKELAAILKKSSLLITNDSAPMHIAWAVGTPIVAVFGPTDPEKYRPLGAKDIVIRKHLQCSPCQSALCKIDPKRSNCMDSVSQEEVFNAAKSILAL